MYNTLCCQCETETISKECRTTTQFAIPLILSTFKNVCIFTVETLLYYKHDIVQWIVSIGYLPKHG